MNTAKAPTNGLFILTTTGDPPMHEQALPHTIFTLYKERYL